MMKLKVVVSKPLSKKKKVTTAVTGAVVPFQKGARSACLPLKGVYCYLKRYTIHEVYTLVPKWQI